MKKFIKRIPIVRTVARKLYRAAKNIEIRRHVQRFRRSVAGMDSLLSLTTSNGTPNINELNERLKDLPVIQMNLKNMGYNMAKQLAESLKVKIIDSPKAVGLKSKPTTQEDMESEWLWYWLSKIGRHFIYHRKIWELCYVPQAIFEYGGGFGAEKKGIGFGCGQEPLPSLFASMGCRITVTDLHPEKVKGMGWDTTGQHTAALENAYLPGIVDKKTFYDNIDGFPCTYMGLIVQKPRAHSC